jgi:hypothetical protein
MQRFASSYKFIVLAVVFSALALGLTSCGGGGSSNSGSTNTLVIVQPGTSTKLTTVSVNFGEVVAVTAQLQDSSGAPVSTSGSTTWTTDAPTVAGITTTGALCGDSSTATTCICGGEWKNNNIDCAPPSASTSATITAKLSTGETATAKVFVHPRIARLAITTPVATDCTSSTGTLQLTAQAFDSNGNAITIGNDATAFRWFSGDTSIATVDVNGLATAVNPGKGNVFVSVGSSTSVPYAFATCAVKSINLHVKDVTDTSFTADKATSKTLVADVVDTKDKAITISGSRIVWSSNVPGIVTVDQTGNVTTVDAGNAGIVASCTPPVCNAGLNSVFSNVVTASVNGTGATQVLAANSSGTSLIPIDTTTNVAGTAVTLPFNPNSIVYANNGAKAFLGSGTSLMTYDPTAGTVTSSSNLPGLVQAVSSNAQYVVIFDNSANTVTVFDANNSGVQDRFAVSGIPNPCKTATTDNCPRASFTPDSRTAFIVAGSNLYISNPNTSLRTVPLGTTANDVAVSAQGSFAFVANSDSTIVPFATCNNSKVSGSIVTTSAPANRINSSVDGSALYALVGPTLNIISPTTNAVGCVPSLTDPLTTVDLGQGTFNEKQTLLSTRGDRLYFITGGNNVVVYDKTANTGSAISLAANANGLSAGLTPDGTMLYVGGSDNAIHRIDTTTKTDAGEIPVSFTPDLVAVRPK